VKLLFFGYFLPNISLRVFLLIDEGLDFGVADLEDPFDDIRSGSDDMFDIVFANLIVQFFQDFFFMIEGVLLRVFQLASLVAAEVVET
jgi:hypothetical protein